LRSMATAEAGREFVSACPWATRAVFEAEGARAFLRT